MKKVFCLFFLYVAFLLPFSLCETLKAGVSEEYVPNEFYGSWAVVSKIIDTNNHGLFNSESKDVWILSGYGNVLLLQNLASGARSEITIKEKVSNSILKFEREKTVKNSASKKTVYKETVQFALNGDKFTGTDNFVVENWQNEKLIKKSSAKYKVSGIRITGKPEHSER